MQVQAKRNGEYNTMEVRNNIGDDRNVGASVQVHRETAYAPKLTVCNLGRVAIHEPAAQYETQEHQDVRT